MLRAIPLTVPAAPPSTRPGSEPWFDAFLEGFRAWFGDPDTPRDPQRAIPLLCDAARLGHGGSALLLSNVFEELARDADERQDGRTARTYNRLSLVYRTAAFWSPTDDPTIELEHETKDAWDAARAAPREPVLWDAIDALSGIAHEPRRPDPAAALRAFEALAEHRPVHAGFLASIAAEEAAEANEDPLVASGLMERARTHLVRSAGAGNRAAQKRLFHARAGEVRA